MAFSASDPVRAFGGDKTAASEHDLTDSRKGDFHADLKFVSVRITNHKHEVAIRREPSPVEFVSAHNAKAVFGDQFNRPRTRRSTVNFQVFFLNRHSITRASSVPSP